MWEYNFEHYNLFCKIMNLKASHFKSLINFKEFIDSL